MAEELLNLLTSGGPFASTALFIYLWQRSEFRHDATRKELNDLRDAYEVKTEAHTKTLLDLQEKRLVDAGRVEGIASSTTAAISANSALIRGVLAQLQPRGGR